MLFDIPLYIRYGKWGNKAHFYCIICAKYLVQTLAWEPWGELWVIKEERRIVLNTSIILILFHQNFGAWVTSV